MIIMIIAIVIIMLFVGGMGYAIGNSDGDHPVAGVIGAVIVIVIMAFVIWAGLEQKKAEIEYYNDGICTICGGEYEFSGATRYRSSSEYFYTCKDCGHTIQTSGIMK